MMSISTSTAMNPYGGNTNYMATSPYAQPQQAAPTTYNAYPPAPATTGGYGQPTPTHPMNPFEAYANPQQQQYSAYPQGGSYGGQQGSYNTDGYSASRPNTSPWGQYNDPYAQQNQQMYNPFAEKASFFNDRANLNNFQANQFALKQPMGADALTAVGGNKDFSILNSAVGAAGLGDPLKKLEKDGPITILAPTDKAFGKLPPDLAKALALPENKEILQQILMYHVGGAAHQFGQQPMVFDSFLANDQNVIIGNAVNPSVVNGNQVVQGSGSAFRTENNSVVIPISDLLLPPGLDLSKIKMPGKGTTLGTPTTPAPTTPTVPGTPTTPAPTTPTVPGTPTTPAPTTPTVPGTPTTPAPTTPPATAYPTVGGMPTQTPAPATNIYGQPVQVAQSQGGAIQPQAFMGAYNMGTTVL
jgi:uncharacterized surface protein with fasciclin (FAS1) repeats